MLAARDKLRFFHPIRTTQRAADRRRERRSMTCRFSCLVFITIQISRAFQAASLVQDDGQTQVEMEAKTFRRPTPCHCFSGCCSG